MKIISPYRDYYDRALAFGYDEHTIYVRKPIELYNSHDGVLREVKDFDDLLVRIPLNDIRGKDDSTLSFSAVQVVFCGKLYRGIRVTMKPHWSRIQEGKTGVYYSGESLQHAVENFGGSIDVNFKRAARMWWSNQFFRDNTLNSWMSVQGSPALESWAIENKYIVLVIEENAPTRVIHNARLADYDFYRAIDPVTAYQELDMYISGVLTSAGNPMIMTEDKYKIQAAGFDKHSFRKHPTKRK